MTLKRRGGSSREFRAESGPGATVWQRILYKNKTERARKKVHGVEEKNNMKDE